MFSGKYGNIIAPRETARELRLRALPDGLPRGNKIPYFPESMKYYYNMAL